MIKSIRRLIAAVALFGFITAGAMAEGITAEESFKVVQNMLNLVQTEYIEDTPPSQIVTGAFDNLNAALEEKGVAYRVPTSVPEEMTSEEAASQHLFPSAQCRKETPSP